MTQSTGKLSGKMDTKKVIYLLTENCKSRMSCEGCSMSGKHSLKDTCLLHSLVGSMKQKQLPTQKQIEETVIAAYGSETVEDEIRHATYHLFEGISGEK